MRYARIAGLIWIAAAFGSVRADDWQITRFEGRDYVPLENVARFYGLPAPGLPVEKKIALEHAGKQLEVTLNSREIQINGVRHWLSFPAHTEGEQVFISRLDLVKALEPLLRPERLAGLGAVKTIVLDPGHGGHDKGATCIYGCEKDFALDVCLRAKPLLESAGYKVVLTRSTDVFIPLEERPRVANRIPESIFVSVHFNCSNENRDASGFEIFSIAPRGAPATADQNVTSHALRSEPGNAMDNQSVMLAGSIFHSLLGHITEVDRGMKRARFAVIRLATVPAVLVEGGFVSNSADSQLIATATWRQQLASSIVNGIEGFKKLAETKQPPKVVADYRREQHGGVVLREATNLPLKPTPAVVAPTQP